jgi:hypothetical protein
MEGWRKEARILSRKAENPYPTAAARARSAEAFAGDVPEISPGGKKMSECLLWFAILAAMTWDDCRRWGVPLRVSLLSNLILLVLLAWFLTLLDS